MYCRQCGNQIAIEARHCSSCGTEVIVLGGCPAPNNRTAKEASGDASGAALDQSARLNGTDYERFYAEITFKAVTDTVERLLKYPFGFHGDTGIRDLLYARLHFHGGSTLDFDDPRAGCSTLLLQSEHYTAAKYKNTGQSSGRGRFDLALTKPPQASDEGTSHFAENLEALFAFELGRNKPLAKLVDPDTADHRADTVATTSDVSKLHRELRYHDLRQGWAIEFYDSRTPGGAIIEAASKVCERLSDIGPGKKLIVVFVEYSPSGEKHHVSSNDRGVQASLAAELFRRGLQTAPGRLSSQASLAAGPSRHGLQAASGRLSSPSSAPRATGGDRWAASATVEQVFGASAGFAARIILTAAMEQRGRSSGYVNLYRGSSAVAQLHPRKDGIALVLRARGSQRPVTTFTETPVASLSGYTGLNKPWLDGAGKFTPKGPAIAFLLPSRLEKLGDGDPGWIDLTRLLEHAKTLA